MKKLHILFTLLCIAALAACTNPFRGGGSGEGTITIAFTSAARIALETTDIADMTFHLTLTSGETTVTGAFTGGGSYSIEVAPGTWTISIRAEGPRPEVYDEAIFTQEPMLRALGFGTAPIEVRAGQDSSASVHMISATEVRNAAQLASAISHARPHDAGETIILIMGDISDVRQTIYVPVGRNITLAAHTSVAITQAEGFGGYIFFHEEASPFFTLGCDRPGMAGSITVADRHAPTPTITITIGLADFADPLRDIDLAGPTIHLVGTPEQQSATIAVTPEAFDEIAWHFGGVEITDSEIADFVSITGTYGEFLTLNSISTTGEPLYLGIHLITVRVTMYRDGVPEYFSRRIALEVVL